MSTAPEFMKLIFAVFYFSRMMGFTSCYKTQVRFTYIFAVFLQYFMLFLLVTAV